MKQLKDNYVFPDVAQRMVETVQNYLGKRTYDQAISEEAFCDLLTEHLQQVSHDKHLRVRIRDAEARSSSDSDQVSTVERLIAQNYGFNRVERLAGNVGYIELKGFASAEYAGQTLVHTMGFVANTDALIIDLRENGGGVPSMVCLFCSYLLTEEPLHLNSFYWRPSNETQQFWTFPFVPGERYIGKPVYLLTSRRTFSGAEEFAYDLQVLKRAMVVGERTRGGAHPGREYPLSDSIDVFIPSGRAINPITGGNWEGRGVQPDVEVSEADALRVAHVRALTEIQTAKTGMSKFQLREIHSALAELTQDVR